MNQSSNDKNKNVKIRTGIKAGMITSPMITRPMITLS